MVGCVNCSCQQLENKKFSIITDLPPLLKEVSGITWDRSTHTLLAINDSGNGNIIYKLNTRGEILGEVRINQIKNKDWEAITTDRSHKIYIGDFGNNRNERKFLKIYILENLDSTSPLLNTIIFSLSDQEKYPPKKKNRNFDIESMIVKNDNIYLFSRNRGTDFNGKTKIYRLKNEPGTQSAKLVNTLYIGNDNDDCFITDAAINADHTQIALLTYNKIIVLDSFEGGEFWEGSFTKIKLQHQSQKEGITFLNDSTLLIVDEKKKGTANFLYQYQLNK